MHRSPNQHARNTRRREAPRGTHVADEAVHDVPRPRHRNVGSTLGAAISVAALVVTAAACSTATSATRDGARTVERPRSHPDRHGRSAHHDHRNHDGRSNNLSRSAHDTAATVDGRHARADLPSHRTRRHLRRRGWQPRARPLCWLRGHDRDPDRRVRREW